MDEKREFIAEWEKAEASIAELCRHFEISRETGYKWLKRYEQSGAVGLEEWSRAPHKHPQQMSREQRERILEVRQAHARWGPRKLRAHLQRLTPAQRWPSASSIGALLQREGLAHPRRKRHRTPPCTQPLAHAQAPNQVWCADYKGWFRCGDGTRCDPLTISDAYSRYLLRCRAVEKSDEIRARMIFEAVFREYGLPDGIRTDNGPPFASPAPAGLSRLSIWWIRLGIRVERIEPGHPEQNGQHERMHQTLQQETAQPPQSNLSRQQDAFRRFEQEYNQVRPHEALGYRTPAELYVASARPYPYQLPELEYATGMYQRRISSAGEMKWNARNTFISKVLAGEMVGLQEVQDHLYEVYYGPLLLGWFDSAEAGFVADCAPHWPSAKVKADPPTGGSQ